MRSDSLALSAFEMAINCLLMAHDYLPATVNLSNPDPECDLDFVPNKPRKQQVDIALSNSFGFGGHNATLVFKRWLGE